MKMDGTQLGSMEGHQLPVVPLMKEMCRKGKLII